MKNILLLLLSISSFMVSAQVYKWTDDKGNVIFSDRPQHGDATVYSEIQGDSSKATSGADICQLALQHELKLYQREKPDEVITEVLKTKKAAAWYLKFCEQAIKEEGNDRTFQCILQNHTVASMEACSVHLKNKQ